MVMTAVFCSRDNAATVNTTTTTTTRTKEENEDSKDMNESMVQPKESHELFPLSSPDCFDSAKLKKLQRSKKASAQAAEHKRLSRWQTLSQAPHDQMSVTSSSNGNASAVNSSFQGPSPMLSERNNGILRQQERVIPANERSSASSVASKKPPKMDGGALQSLAFLSQSRTSVASASSSAAAASSRHSTTRHRPKLTPAAGPQQQQQSRLTIAPPSPGSEIPPQVVLTVTGDSDNHSAFDDYSSDNDQWSHPSQHTAESNNSYTLWHLTSLLDKNPTVPATPRVAISSSTTTAAAAAVVTEQEAIGLDEADSSNSKTHPSQSSRTTTLAGRCLVGLVQIVCLVAVVTASAFLWVLWSEYYTASATNLSVGTEPEVWTNGGVLTDSEMLSIDAVAADTANVVVVVGEPEPGVVAARQAYQSEQDLDLMEQEGAMLPESDVAEVDLVEEPGVAEAVLEPTSETETGVLLAKVEFVEEQDATVESELSGLDNNVLEHEFVEKDTVAEYDKLSAQESSVPEHEVFDKDVVVEPELNFLESAVSDKEIVMQPEPSVKDIDFADKDAVVEPEESNFEESAVPDEAVPIEAVVILPEFEPSVEEIHFADKDVLVEPEPNMLESTVPEHNLLEEEANAVLESNTEDHDAAVLDQDTFAQEIVAVTSPKPVMHIPQESESTEIPTSTEPLSEYQLEDQWDTTLLSIASRDDFVYWVQSNYWKRPFGAPRAHSPRILTPSTWQSLVIDFELLRFGALMDPDSSFLLKEDWCRPLDALIERVPNIMRFVRIMDDDFQDVPLIELVADFLQQKRQQRQKEKQLVASLV